ncbi:hypothetical protein GUJ93_ZPchr0012g21029 [Zizania palustris]|uniref:SHSP domain-containing protein n=1 Tax=Zizania palustris TaxID=103762 RepID=A0A8J6BV68_ZIZPA|nr:hypothetical protein GUJ93_ZPchr0012g21029 [Zizania palustris]
MNSAAVVAAAAGRAYDDFKPPHKMVSEPTTHTLSVDLSTSIAGHNYKKEHIKVQLVHSRRLLVVSGECPVGAGNRWSRFRLEFPVPDGCDVKAIHARFANGVVRVTMPGRKKEQEPAPPPVAATTPLRGVRRLLPASVVRLLQERGKLSTTIVGVVLVLFSFFIFVRFSLKP